MKAWGNASSQSFSKKNKPIIISSEPLIILNKASHDAPPPASPVPIMDRKSARAESDRRRKAKETYLEPLPTTTTSSDAHDFCLDFPRNLNHRAQARAVQLQTFPDTVAVHYRSMVPKKVSEKEFWERYYFRCDVDRIMAEGQGGGGGRRVFINQDHHHQHGNNDTQSMVSSITHEFEPTSFESSSSSFHYHNKPPTSIPVPTNVPQRRTSAPVVVYGAASSTQLKTRTIPKVELHSKVVAESSSSSYHKKPTTTTTTNGTALLYDSAQLKTAAAAPVV